VIRIETQRVVNVPFLGDRTVELSSTARYRCEI
jgi:hypothetical protein